MGSYDGQWSAHDITALELAYGCGPAEFARQLGVTPRTLRLWKSERTTTLRASSKRLLSTVWHEAPGHVKAEFHRLRHIDVADIRGSDAMAMSRRGFIAAAGAALIAAPSPDVDYVEHFRALKRVLVDQDSLLGPTTVIPIVEQQVQVIDQLRRHRDVDRAGLRSMRIHYAEFAGWLHQDAGDHVAAEYWSDRALQWALEADDRTMSSYILQRKAHLAGDIGVDGEQVVDLSAAAIRCAPGGTPIEALAAMRSGYGHALLHDAYHADRAYDSALEALESPDMNPDLPWSGWFTESYVAVHRARALTVLRDYPRAVQQFTAVLDTLPAHYARDRAVYQLRAAIAHVGNRDVEQAATLGSRALSHGGKSGSGRLVHEAARLDALLEPWAGLPAVSEFHTARLELAA